MDSFKNKYKNYFVPESALGTKLIFVMPLTFKITELDFYLNQFVFFIFTFVENKQSALTTTVLIEY